MILNLETLSLEARNIVLGLSAEAIGHSDGVFRYEGKQYEARSVEGGQIEIKEFFPIKSRMDRWTQTQKDSFKLLVDAAKKATNSSGRRFEFDGITVSVQILADGKAILNTRLVRPEIQRLSYSSESTSN